MRFVIEKWKIRELIAHYKKNHLNLNPPYQRNDIWTETSQKNLIESIKEGMPIPNFFFHKRKKDYYDIADGQQRTRAILAYSEKEISDSNNVFFKNEAKFLDYEIPIVVINEDITEEEIRLFYVKVNNTGLRLNKPELTKATFFNSKVLKLVEELSELKSFTEMGIFSTKQEERMVDREFVEELVAQIKYGISDKKNIIKRLYEENIDIADKELKNLKESFESVLKVCSTLNKSFEFKNTRYSQKNDFYTLFGFILNNLTLKQSSFHEFFALLVKIQDDISPSNEDCEPLQFYAYRCVSQSNSKSAREDRISFFNSLLLNTKSTPNVIQNKLMKYYKLKDHDLVKIEGYLTFRTDNIETKFIED